MDRAQHDSTPCVLIIPTVHSPYQSPTPPESFIMGPIISIETATKLDPRFPSYCVTKYEVLEDGDVIRVFSDPVAAEDFAYEYAEEVFGTVEDCT